MYDSINELFPFTDADYRPQLGLKNLELQDWLLVDGEADNQRALKRKLMKTERSTVLQILPGNDAAIFELRDVLAAHLGGCSEGTALDAASALAELTTWTQEDWVLLSPKAPVTIQAGCVCFPSRWSLKEKLGRDPFAVHASVPDFANIARQTAVFLERVSTDKPMWRLNWTIHDSDKLFCPGPHPSAKDLTTDNILQRTFLRLERQTLRRLPKTGYVAFSIRTFVHPLLLTLVVEGRRETLRRSLERLPRETAVYKGMGGFVDLLIAALA